MQWKQHALATPPLLVGDGGMFSHPSPLSSLPTPRERLVQGWFMT
jgi:hypothetical protein